MKKKLSKWWATIIQLITIPLILFIFQTPSYVKSAIAPPPWSDPTKNPCASLPGGWQLLYWAPLKKCFRIFQVGYPCPDTMELSPALASRFNKIKNKEIMTAECRCPPGTAQSALTNKCHQLFEQDPCESGQYFSPLPDVPGIRFGNRWGTCKTPKQCPEGMILWPRDNKCYSMYTRGPCTKGKLIAIGEDGLAQCKCENSGDLREYFHHIDETCHEHYTKGPCQTHGYIFLPGGKCGCSAQLPHYHEYTNQCYELGTIGPCPPGHLFIIADNPINGFKYATCECKEDYVRWKDGICYRLYTRGPCGPNEFLVNSTTCITNFCGKGQLYFPEQKTCYRIGTQGPCSLYQVVIFDFTSRPSIDGVSYNGICGCSGVIMNLDQKCPDLENIISENTCESSPGMVELNGNCYKLYSRGPCGPGQWLEPYKEIKNDIKFNKAKCKCRPGYKSFDEMKSQSQQQFKGFNSNTCYSPNVGIARYLNDQQSRSYKTYQFTNSTYMSNTSLLAVNVTDTYQIRDETL